MRHRKLIYGVLLGLFVLALVLAGIIFVQKSNELKVIFLDVGQGDAILISQGSKQILIDGGPSGQILLEKLGKYVPFWDRNIEVVIATHPDADHIGGLVDAMEKYEVGEVIDDSLESDSQIFKKYEEVIAADKIPELKGERGVNIKLSDQASLKILSPGQGIPINTRDTNASSVVARLSFGDNSFLFTGDLPSEQETELLQKNLNLQSRVLKVAHHGSKYSTSQEFLDAVNPQDAVISVGRNNRYGHPAQEILDRLRSKKVRIMRTDELGDIEYDCANIDIDCVMVAN